MAKVLPFKAVRPIIGLVSQVVSNSFEHYTEEELQVILTQNPNSFLQIITAGITPDGTNKITNKERFDLVKSTYQEFKKQNRYQKELAPSYYVHQIKNQHGTFTGITAKTSTQDYANNVIKKHEEIISSRKRNFAKYLKHVGFNADPVLLTYPDNTTIDTLVNSILTTNPTYNFTTETNEHHKLWAIDNPDTLQQLTTAFAAIPELYIADGHHRCASSYELARIMTEKTKNASTTSTHHYFMSYLLPESQVKIHQFNRLVTDLNGQNAEELLSKISEYYQIEKLGSQGTTAPINNLEFYMYLEGFFYRLSLKKEIYKFTDILSHLPPQLLNQTILQPLLGITDPRKDERIQYVHTQDSLSEIKNQVDNGTFKIGFSMNPITIKSLKAIADAQLKMPPKSTYVLPKLPSGLLLYEF